MMRIMWGVGLINFFHIGPLYKNLCTELLSVFKFSEFLDDIMMDACNKFSGLDYPAMPTLFLEFNGSEQSVNEQAKATGQGLLQYFLVDICGGVPSNWTTHFWAEEVGGGSSCCLFCTWHFALTTILDPEC